MALIPTAWGNCAVVWKCRDSESCDDPFARRPANPLVCRIFTPGLSDSQLRQSILCRYPACHEVLCDDGGNFHPDVVPEWFTELVHYLQSYYSNGLRDWTQPRFTDHWAYWKPRLDWSGLTPFQSSVLEKTAGIGCGLQMTYGQIASALGKPRAGRAVGAALGSNPWPILIPCHRVVGHSGKLTGFSAPGGIETKRRMLALEKPHAKFR